MIKPDKTYVGTEIRNARMTEARTGTMGLTMLLITEDGDGINHTIWLPKAKTDTDKIERARQRITETLVTLGVIAKRRNGPSGQKRVL